jgi:pantothenate kinase
VLVTEYLTSYFYFANDDIEKCIDELLLIKKYKNLLAEDVVLVCLNGDSEFYDRLETKNDITVIGIESLGEYLSEIIAYKEETLERVDSEYVDNYDVMIEKYGYCNDLYKYRDEN